MAKKIDLTTIAKEYADGKISKEDFLYLHKMLTSAASNKATQAPQPPVLKQPVLQQPVQTQQRQPRQQQAPRRIVRPSAQQQAVPPHQQTQSRKQPVYSSPEPVTFVPELLQQRAGGFSAIGYIRKHHKEVVTLIGTLGIFISMFYNKMQAPPPDQGNSRVVMVQSDSNRQSPSIRTQDIKLIAQLMMEDNSWNKELIDDFVSQWNKLSRKEKDSVKQTDWYLDFSSMLSQQIKTAGIKAKTGDVAAIYNQQALLGLADSLVFGENSKAQQLLAETVKSNSYQPAVEEPALKKPESKSDKQAVRQTDSVKETVEKVSTPPVQMAKTNPESNKNNQSSERHRISRTEIEDMINRLTVAIEAGQSSDLSTLFADQDYSSSYASLSRVKKEFKDLFLNTRDRQIDLSSFFWEHDYDEARGTAKYKLNAKMKDADVNQVITAELDVTLRRLLGKVYITDFKLNGKKIASSAATAKSVAVVQPAKIVEKDKPNHPTPAELQDLVTQYVTAYETGDVKELMQLFASATWTKGRAGMIEMKQSYENLFLSTSGREVFIKNIDWKYKDDKALGTGELLLTLHNRDNRIETKKGKIRIVAEKSRDSVRFTQMFHIVD